MEDRSHLVGCLIAIACLLAGSLRVGAEESSPAEPLIRLIESGRVPEERLGTIIEFACERGNASDLAKVFAKVVDPKGFSAANRRKALEELANTALERKVKPSGDLKPLARFIDGDGVAKDRALRLVAVRLVGIWGVTSLGEPVRKIALAANARDTLREAALDALAALDDKPSRDALVQLTAKDRPQPIRYQAVAALANSGDLAETAKRAVEVLNDGKDDDPSPVIMAFLNRQKGADALAAALAKHKPPGDVAKLALRAMYAVGRSDASLVSVLSDAAGIKANPKPPTSEEIKEIEAAVRGEGDPARGEIVFRRADLSCMKCHSVSKAGGDVGPELSSVGAQSPVDYLVNSILQPDLAIKEQFQTAIIYTTRGKIHTGVVADKDENKIVLKDATGKRIVVPADDIDEQLEGKSLMPKGLANFMTRAELIDLVAFLSQLGKPGEYAIRTTPTIQRWRVLRRVPPALAESVPNTETFTEEVLRTSPNAWAAAYAKVGGQLPLSELTATHKTNVLYLMGEIDVTQGGPVAIQIDSPREVDLWVNDEALDPDENAVVELSRGRHKVVLRVDTSQRGGSDIKVTITKPVDSSAEFTVVGGP